MHEEAELHPSCRPAAAHQLLLISCWVLMRRCCACSHGSSPGTNADRLVTGMRGMSGCLAWARAHAVRPGHACTRCCRTLWRPHLLLLCCLGGWAGAKVGLYPHLLIASSLQSHRLLSQLRAVGC